MSLCEVAQAIRKKRVSSLEVVRACIERAKAVQPAVNCFIAIEEDEVLRAARVADRAVKRGAKLGPLHGVPLAYKEWSMRRARLHLVRQILRRLPVRPVMRGRVARPRAPPAPIWLGKLNMTSSPLEPDFGTIAHRGDARQSVERRARLRRIVERLGRCGRRRPAYGALRSDTGGSIRLPAAC